MPFSLYTAAPPRDPPRWLTWGLESDIRIIITQQSPPSPCRNGKDPGGWMIHPNAKKSPPKLPPLNGGSLGGLILLVLWPFVGPYCEAMAL